MKKVLIITYFFPPDLDGGVFRPLKFTKYLPQYGWTPVILKSRIKLQKRFPKDVSLSKDLPPKLKIIETFSLCKAIYMLEGLLGLKNNALQLPDYQLGWLPFAIFTGVRTIFKEDIDMIYTTGPPHSTHLIGLMLKKICNIPWVVDFRDPWAKNFLKNKYPSKIHKRVDEKLERKVVEYSDRVITVTDPIRDDFIEEYKFITKDKFVTIPNGYDLNDFKELSTKKNKKFIITYTGSFYGSISPDGIFKCLKELLLDKPELNNSIKFIIAGQMFEELITKQIRNYGLENIVEFKGLVSYRESLKLMVNSDVLLLILPAGNRIKKVYTSKLFNYLAAGRPILGIIPRGIAADLITETNSGLIIDPEDVEGIKAAIYNLYVKYSHGTLRGEVDLKKIEGYNREKLTEKLARVFDDVV